MEAMRIFVKSDVPESALAALNELQGISAGNGLIEGGGEFRPEEGSLLLFYEAEGHGKGEVRPLDQYRLLLMRASWSPP